METSYDSILDFKADWDIARKYMEKEENILGTGITYEFDTDKDSDHIITPDGKQLGLISSSSGIQSLIPQYVHLGMCFDLEIVDMDGARIDKVLVRKEPTENQQ